MALISSMEAFSTPLLHGVPPACAAKLSGGCPLPPTGPWGANASFAGPLGRGGARLLCHGHGYISHRIGSRAWVLVRIQGVPLAFRGGFGLASRRKPPLEGAVMPATVPVPSGFLGPGTALQADHRVPAGGGGAERMSKPSREISRLLFGQVRVTSRMRPLGFLPGAARQSSSLLAMPRSLACWRSTPVRACERCRFLAATMVERGGFPRSVPLEGAQLPPDVYVRGIDPGSLSSSSKATFCRFPPGSPTSQVASSPPGPAKPKSCAGRPSPRQCGWPAPRTSPRYPTPGLSSRLAHRHKPAWRGLAALRTPCSRSTPACPRSIAKANTA